MKRKVVAITGGIGSGKSAVASILRSKGFDVLDCDALAREVADRAELVAAVQKLLGDDCVTDGKLNRKHIREIVFADKELLKRYSQLFWKGTKDLLCENLDKLGQIVFVEISVYSAFSFDWYETWLVESDVRLRTERVVQRDGVSKDNVQNVMTHQQICSNFNRRIENNGSMSELEKQIEDLLAVAKL